jgi:hypothetical protein
MSMTINEINEFNKYKEVDKMEGKMNNDMNGHTFLQKREDVNVNLYSEKDIENLSVEQVDTLLYALVDEKKKRSEIEKAEIKRRVGVVEDSVFDLQENDGKQDAKIDIGEVERKNLKSEMEQLKENVIKQKNQEIVGEEEQELIRKAVVERARYLNEKGLFCRNDLTVRQMEAHLAKLVRCKFKLSKYKKVTVEQFPVVLKFIEGLMPDHEILSATVERYNYQKEYNEFIYKLNHNLRLGLDE